MSLLSIARSLTPRASMLMSVAPPRLASFKATVPGASAVSFRRGLKAQAAQGSDVPVEKESQSSAPASQQQQQKGGVQRARRGDRGAVSRFSPMAPTVFSPGTVARMMQDLDREVDNMFRGLSAGFPSMMPSMGLPSLLADFDTDALAPAVEMLPNVAVDVKENDKEFALTADVPGMSKDDIKIKYSPRDRVLSISGERKKEEEKDVEEGRVHRVERAYGMFERRFVLPENVDTENIKAKVDHGLLKLTIPKMQTEEHAPREIAIESSA